MYNKDKPETFRVKVFILANAKYYLIYLIDVYQGKIAENIDIQPSLHNLPTTQKVVANSIINNRIENIFFGYIHRPDSTPFWSV